jgi:glutamate racemase
VKPIGIVDSGLGGVSVVLALHHAYPELAMVYLADQIHAPYGNKSKQEICEIMEANMRWFQSQGIKEVLLACNTASSNALEFLHQRFPAMKINGIIDVTVNQLTHGDCVGVLATSATIASHAYKSKIEKKLSCRVIEQAAPELVAMVENLADESQLSDVLDDYCASLKDCDTVVLGCTHYPLIKNLIAMKVSGKIVDSIEPVILSFKDKDYPKGDVKIYTTKDPVHLKQQIKFLFNEDVEVLKGVVNLLGEVSSHTNVQQMLSIQRTVQLSQSALETLAIIAYKQPITRVEIEDIRGVGCDVMLRKLQALDLIREKGRSEAPGRPILYEVTQEFMDVFQLMSQDGQLRIIKVVRNNAQELYD